MTIFIYGIDIYRSRQKLKEFIDHYKEARKSGLNLKIFEGKKISFEDFKYEFFSSSMFAEKKLFIIKEVFSNQEFKDKFLKDSKKFIKSQNIVLFYEEGGISETDKLLKLLVKSGKSQEFKALQGVFLRKWLEKEIKKLKIGATSEAINKLIEFVGNDTWRLANEIQKLASFKQNQKIEVRDVEILVKPEFENNIFEMIDEIGLRNKKKALKLLRQHIEKGENALYLLSMINFQFRNLLIVKELVERNLPYYLIVKNVRMKPFVLRKTYQQAQRFGLSELKKIYRKIFQTDLEIKTGKIDSEIGLELLIAAI